MVMHGCTSANLEQALKTASSNFISLGQLTFIFAEFRYVGIYSVPGKEPINSDVSWGKVPFIEISTVFPWVQCLEALL